MQEVNCNYSTPLTYDGSAPISGAQYWQFSQESCQVPIATPSSNTSPTATFSGIVMVDTASTSALSSDLNNLQFDFFTFALIAILCMGAAVGSWAFNP